MTNAVLAPGSQVTGETRAEEILSEVLRYRRMAHRGGIYRRISRLLAGVVFHHEMHSLLDYFLEGLDIGVETSRLFH